MSWLIDVFSLFAVALREYFSQFGAVERSQVLFVSIIGTSGKEEFNLFHQACCLD